MKKRSKRSLRHGLRGLTKFVRRFGGALRRNRALLAVSLGGIFVEVGLRAMEPWPMQLIFDRLLGVHRAGRGLNVPALHALDASVLLALAGLAIIVIHALRGLADYVGTVGFARIGNAVLSEAREELYRHLQRLSLSFHTRARGGDLTLRVMHDINLLKDAVITALLPLLANLVVLVGMVGMMFWLHWQLALVAIAPLPVFGLWTFGLARRIQETARAQRKRESTMAAGAAEALGAIKVVQALSLEEAFARAFARGNRDSQLADVKGHRLVAALERAAAFFIAAATALVLWYGARLVLSGELTPGELLVFLAYLKTTFKPAQDFAKFAGRLAKAGAAGERVLDLLDREPEVRNLPGAVHAGALRGAVRFENVCFAYETGRRVLDGVDFAVEPGARVAIVGPSGTGKSTLASLLSRLYDPTEGCVLIDDRDVREYTLESLRGQISVVMQDSLLFAASVRENIAFGAEGATPQDVEKAARLANAHEFIVAMPQGYDTVLGERGVTLSGGQRQRLAIARAAIRHSPLLILDEPAAGLDEENARAVMQALDRLARGRTAFLITHDLPLAASANSIVYLEQGRVMERGTHDELMRADGRYARLYRLQTMSASSIQPHSQPLLVE